MFAKSFSSFASIALAFCLAVAVAGPSGAQQPTPSGQKRIATMATVNGRPISRQQLANEAMRRFGNDVLESIINKLLIMNELRELGIQITEADINRSITEKAEKFGLSADRYLKLIESKRNVKIDQYKNDIVWNELALRRIAESSIKVTPEELAERMEFEFGAKVQVRQIALSDLEAAKTLREILRAEPGSFEKMAKQHSIDTNSASMGGLLPPIRRNSGLPEFEKVAFGLQPGQISEIFKVDEVFFVLRCERIFAGEELTNEQITQVHERLVEEITRDKLRRSALDLFRTLQDSAQIVNVMNDSKLSKQMPGVAATVNGIKVLKNQVAEECITRYGKMMLEVEINRTLLVQALERNGMAVKQEEVTAEIKRAAELVKMKLPSGEVNIDEYLALVTGNDKSKVDFYIEDEVWPTVALKKLVVDKVEVTDEDMEKGYEANFGPGVDVLAIVFHDQRSATKIWKMAAANPTAEYFGQLANQYSIEPASKNNFGQVPPVKKFGGQPELEAEAFSLSKNELSKVIQLGEHWAILFCKGRTNPQVADFDAVEEELFNNIHEKKIRLAMREEIQRIHQDAQIDNYLTGTSQTGKAMVRSARLNQKRLPVGTHHQ
jgi:parvulin-like peptidyl-prolyl isomerase